MKLLIRTKFYEPEMITKENTVTIFINPPSLYNEVIIVSLVDIVSVL